MHTTDTSRQALTSMSMPRRKSLLDEIETAITQLQRLGARDASMREIQQHLERHLGRRVDVSSISARVNELESANRVARDRTCTRPCLVTGQAIHPLSIVPQQRRMFA